MAPLIPTLTTIKKDGSTGYKSIVVTRCDSGIETLEDAAGKVHAFADPDSAPPATPCPTSTW